MQTKEKALKPQRGIGRITIIVLSVLMTLACFSYLAVQAFFSIGLSKEERTLTLGALDAALTVTRGEEGLPHIKAQSSRALYIAQATG